MKLNWMPLDIADYRADTAHLGALEHGIYLLLIMHYWQTGGLPDDDKQLARIACATPSEWRGSRAIIERFFLPGWKHKRVEQELAKARDISSKRRGAALQMHEERRANAPASAEQVHTPLTLTLTKKDKSISLGEAKREASPPRHCATTPKDGGRVYVVKGTPEWEAYAADYRAAHGREPNVNPHGGKWFKTMGEASA